jgi:hypothetical protein
VATGDILRANVADGTPLGEVAQAYLDSGELAPSSGIDKGRRRTAGQARGRRSVHPQTCDWRCRACRIHGQPFYSHGDLQYLKHDSGPLVADLDRLWQAKGR